MNEKTFDETTDGVIQVLREAGNSLNKDLSENKGDIKMLLAQWQEYVNSIEDPDKRKACQINIDEANEKHDEMLRLLLQLYENSPRPKHQSHRRSKSGPGATPRKPK